jgi:hypothetical protein
MSRYDMHPHLFVMFQCVPCEGVTPLWWHVWHGFMVLAGLVSAGQRPWVAGRGLGPALALLPRVQQIQLY